jgi:spore germination protein KC
LKYKHTIVTLVVVVSLLTTGCWDRTELNDQALVMASGVDLTDEGKILLTDQTILPINLSKGLGSTRQEFLTLSATGRDILDAGQNLQTKLSRKYFLGHRRIVFIGEKLAKRGLGDMMDEFTRNPDVRLRSDIFIVKSDTAEHALQIKVPLEQYPALSVIKSRRFVGGTIGTTLLSFLMASACDTSFPTLPVLEIVPETRNSDKKTFKFTGRAVFDKQLKLLGYLNYSEANYRFWVINTITQRHVTFRVENKGYATIDFSHFGSKIQPIIEHDHAHYVVTLNGKGILRESETNVKLKNPNDIHLIEKSAQDEVVQKVSELISKVQKDYGTDIFGFDKAMGRQYPRQWKQMKSKWNKIFPTLPVQVIAHIKITVVGSTSENVVSTKRSTAEPSW